MRCERYAAEVDRRPAAAIGSALGSAPEPYHEAAEKLRCLAQEALLPNIHADLLDLACRSERMATYFEAARRLRAPDHRNKS